MNAHELRRWTVQDIPRGTRVLLRLEVNGQLGDVEAQYRWRQALVEVRALRARGAIILAMGHVGDPGGVRKRALGLAPVARWFADQLAAEVVVITDPFSIAGRKQCAALQPGNMVLFENLRFWPGEEENSMAFAHDLAALGDVYVNNAFGVLHRAHASVVGVPQYLSSFAGELVVREVEALSAKKPAPFIAVQGGAKLSTKLPLLTALLDDVADLYVGGALAVPVAVAAGHSLPSAVRAAVAEEDVRAAVDLLRLGGTKVRVPRDFVLNEEMTRVLDVGPRTADDIIFGIRHAKSLFWNGPLGVIEEVHGQAATRAVAKTVGGAGLRVAIAGGGETVGFLCAENITEGFTHLSTGGGATLAFLAGEKLPGLVTLCGEDRCIL
jgi:phosphoglycerate kinase